MDVNPALIPLQLIKMAGSDSQSGRPSTQLSNPISVKVYDQFGLGLRNQSVVFTIGAGAGTIKKTTDGTFASSITVATDRDGVASVHWALGVAAGEQTVLARLGSLEVLTFKAVSTVSPE